ncbi:hypothetical protein ACFX19_013255 [Malus domestica]
MSESGKGYAFCSNSLKVLLYLTWARGASPLFISFALVLEEILISANAVLTGAVLTVNASLEGFFPVLSTFGENTLSFLKLVIGSFFRDGQYLAPCRGHGWLTLQRSVV